MSLHWPESSLKSLELMCESVSLSRLAKTQPDLIISLHGYQIHMESEPRKSSDHDLMRWFSADEVKDLKVPPADVPILEKLQLF